MRVSFHNGLPHTHARTLKGASYDARGGQSRNFFLWVQVSVNTLSFLRYFRDVSPGLLFIIAFFNRFTTTSTVRR